MKKTSAFQNSLIWFGAAVSIAEILTGTYFAPLGFTKGLLAILVGHVIGCAMFFFAGVIGYLVAFGIVGIFVGPVILAVTFTLLDDWVTPKTQEPERTSSPSAGP